MKRLPAPAGGRSEFIVQALADKLSAVAQSSSGWEGHAARRQQHSLKALPFNAVAKSRAEGGER